jgi:HAD superfamily hydrolase (TIGR01509 family)
LPIAIIFDVDGLLLDTERIAREGWRQALKKRGYTLTDEFYLNLVGRTPEADIPILQAEFSADIPFDEVYADRRQFINDFVDQHGIEDRPGARPLLDYLKSRQVRMAVGSSAPSDYSTKKLALTGLDGYFEEMVFGDQVPNSKPAPDIFLEAARRLGERPHNCIVLEDSGAGVRAAHAAGMRVVMVPDLIQPDDELREIALAVLPDLYAAKRLLEEELIPQSLG